MTIFVAGPRRYRDRLLAGKQAANGFLLPLPIVRVQIAGPRRADNFLGEYPMIRAEAGET